MKRTFGFLLMLIGVVGLLFGGVVFERQRNDLEMGPLVVRHVERERFPIPTIVAALSLLGGALLVSQPRNRRGEHS